ncbi:hypothetical protein LXL04_026646 [Taraxacum kok-saghyz]
MAEIALKMATSTNKLCNRKAFLSRICLSSAVLQDIDATYENSVAQGCKSLLPSLPKPPPVPPQLSSSAGRGGKTEGTCAATGGMSHVLALNPYGRFPNCKTTIRKCQKRMFRVYARLTLDGRSELQSLGHELLSSPSPSTETSFDCDCCGGGVEVGRVEDRLLLCCDLLVFFPAFRSGELLPESSLTTGDGPNDVVQATISNNLLTCAVARVGGGAPLERLKGEIKRYREGRGRRSIGVGLTLLTVANEIERPQVAISSIFFNELKFIQAFRETVLGSFENSYIPENSPNFLYLPNRYSFQKTDFGTLQNVFNHYNSLKKISEKTIFFFNFCICAIFFIFCAYVQLFFFAFFFKFFLTNLFKYFLEKKSRFFGIFFFATGLIFERFLAPRSRFFEKVNGLGVLGRYPRNAAGHEWIGVSTA